MAAPSCVTGAGSASSVVWFQTTKASGSACWASSAACSAPGRSASSASRNTKNSLSASAIPLLRAIETPKSPWCSTCTRGSLAAHASHSAPLLSGLPSLTSTHCSPPATCWLTTLCTQRSSVAAALYTGTTTQTAAWLIGRLLSAKRCGPARQNRGSNFRANTAGRRRHRLPPWQPGVRGRRAGR